MLKLANAREKAIKKAPERSSKERKRKLLMRYPARLTKKY
jgi:hypothetical protein